MICKSVLIEAETKLYSHIYDNRNSYKKGGGCGLPKPVLIIRRTLKLLKKIIPL